MSDNTKNRNNTGTDSKKSKRKQKAYFNEKKAFFWTTVVAGSLAVLLILTLVVGVAISAISNRNIDYMKENLSKYITISKEDYSKFDVDAIFDTVDESDIDRQIMHLLYENKEKDPLYDGAGVKNIPITVGDKVNLFYRGYTINEKGQEVDFEGGSNLAGEMYGLDIGSLEFIKGFEESLIGINPKDYPKFEKVTSGVVMEDDIVFISGKIIKPDGTTETLNYKYIDLSWDYVDEIYGKGFEAFLEGVTDADGKENDKKVIAEEIPDTSFKVEGQTGSYVYTDIKVVFAFRPTAEPLTIEATFPANYREESLRGKTVKFDVYIKNIIVYDTPEYNDEFVTSTLKIDSETLNSYEGATPAEKYRNIIREQLEEENEEARVQILEREMWEHYEKVVKVKKLPKGEVKEIYDQYYNEVASAYTQYQQAYESIDDFAPLYFDISQGEDWREYITGLAEEAVTQRIIFYYIIRQENFIPSEEQFKINYELLVQEHLDFYVNDYYKDELDKLETEEEKQKRIAEIKEEMLHNYGEEYFVENVYYEYGIKELVKYANIINK